MVLVVRIGNELPAHQDKALPVDVREAEWAYVKGLAAGEILRLRDRLIAVVAAPTFELQRERDAPVSWGDKREKA